MPFAKVEVTLVDVRLRTEALMPLVKVEVPEPVTRRVPEAAAFPDESMVNRSELLLDILNSLALERVASVSKK